jgi:predicted CopG family antitoxin
VDHEHGAFTLHDRADEFANVFQGLGELAKGSAIPEILASASLTGAAAFVYGSCMSKTITIDDGVYKLLSSLKRDNGDSFTKVLRRHVHKPAETAGELLDAYEHEPPPKVQQSALQRLLHQRGRRSSGRK